MQRRIRKLLTKVLLFVLTLVYFLTFLILSGDSIIVTDHKPNPRYLNQYDPQKTTNQDPSSSEYEEISEYEVVKNRKPFGLISSNNTLDTRSESELLRLSDLQWYFKRQMINQPYLCRENEDMPEGPFLLLMVNSHV